MDQQRQLQREHVSERERGGERERFGLEETEKNKERVRKGITINHQSHVFTAGLPMALSLIPTVHQKEQCPPGRNMSVVREIQRERERMRERQRGNEREREDTGRG